MPYPHPIRLRGPFDCVSVERAPRVTSADAVSEPAAPTTPDLPRVQLPDDWSAFPGEDFRGRVVYRRNFNRPGTLTAGEWLRLTVAGVDARGSVSLNGQPLGLVAGYALPAEFDITSRLQSRNELLLAVECEEPLRAAGNVGPLRPGREHLPPGPIGEIRLDVLTQFWIDDLSVVVLADAIELTGVVRSRGEHAPASPSASGMPDFPPRQETRVEAQWVDGLASRAKSHALPDATSGRFHLNMVWPSRGEMLRPAAFRLELRLIDPTGGSQQPWWQVALPVRPARDVVWNEPAGRLLVDGIPLALPTAAARISREAGRALFRLHGADESNLAAPILEQGLTLPDQLTLLEAILPDETYDALDAANVCLLQGVPAAWQEHVCPRLARHASIVGWWVHYRPASAPPLEGIESSLGMPEKTLDSLPAHLLASFIDTAWGRPRFRSSA